MHIKWNISEIILNSINFVLSLCGSDYCAHLKTSQTGDYRKCELQTKQVWSTFTVFMCNRHPPPQPPIDSCCVEWISLTSESPLRCRCVFCLRNAWWPLTRPSPHQHGRTDNRLGSKIRPHRMYFDIGTQCSGHVVSMFWMTIKK